MTPEPPYVAVIFTARLRADVTGYDEAVAEMRALAAEQSGYLGMESAGGAPGGFEITVSYWATGADATAWKSVAAHVEAQRAGRERWYERYDIRVARVERAYGGPR